MITVEIIGVEIHQGTVTITATDVSEENLQRIERIRGDNFPSDLEFRYDTRDAKATESLYRWLKHQKAAKNCKTWGEALKATIGTITTISQRYRSWE